MLPRRLALVTAPRADEAFASWVDRMARANRCPSAEVADLMGLRLRGVYAKARPPVFGVQCDEAVRQTVYAATGVPGGTVDRMHLSVFEGGPLSVAAVLSADKAHWPSATREWVEVYGSRACPCCLLASGGVWQLWWKLSCAAVCPKHRVTLLDRCPACGWVLRWGGDRPRVMPAQWVRSPTCCANSVRGKPCSQWLPAIRVGQADKRTVAAQRRWLDTAYNRACPSLGGVNVSAGEWFAAFRACVILLRLGLPQILKRLPNVPDWCGRALLDERIERDVYRNQFGWGPASAGAAAAFLTVVTPLLAAADTRKLTRRLAPLVRTAVEEGCLTARPLARLSVPEVFAEAVAAQVPVGRSARSPWGGSVRGEQ
ncbi:MULTISPECIES: TniQ family protein [unclassified Streptomyces]|uniref:TniQ family protein n=1 Tax=unclassified Streptomyces TaxID=2593676 RepID=UPI001164C527|nr:TniQ family protein [Streptomyces sp. RLA2-12]QDN61419.1 TniQ family protein [Streptomyces sp. S1D4-20]QDN71472.1 TniQ family protein [Streptomyces sp. S1D4-14]QDO53928.1 TniQ family protein [Streptomyces sp. RLB3-5]QDO64173.1 TniQ family protein [Streptomyces sp. RLB1-8]